MTKVTGALIVAEIRTTYISENLGNNGTVSTVAYAATNPLCPSEAGSSFLAHRQISLRSRADYGTKREF